MLLALAILSLLFALIPTTLFLRNLLIYLPLKAVQHSAFSVQRSPISILIPARNEEQSIAAAIESIQKNEHPFELIILDDHSTDATAAIVQQDSQHDPRIRLEQAPPLPPGWCGKQHACHHLASLATHPLLLFLDADVRLAKDALPRLAAHAAAHPHLPLLSGFPRQVTHSLAEDLLIPLMHFILLGFLPLHRMRRSTSPAYAAGCGQLFLARADAYRQIGGHSLVKSSLHDGITLPRAYRQHGLPTDLFDATDLASCRMYTSTAQVWFGLAKNATEGLAAPTLILPVTLMLLMGQVLPFALILMHQFFPLPPAAIVSAGIAAGIAWTPRLYAMIRFRQAPLGAFLHPIGILFLLAIQYYALARHLLGLPPTWKNRAYPQAAP